MDFPANSTDIILKTDEFFTSPSLGELSFSEMLGSIVRYLQDREDFNYRLIVGSDSEVNGVEVSYVVAVAVQRIGAGGIYFWQKRTGAKCFSLKQRIYNEALISLETARRVLDACQAQAILEPKLEVHVDVGGTGETRKIVSEIIGLVRGNGFSVKTKPDSFGASKVADRHT